MNRRAALAGLFWALAPVLAAHAAEPSTVVVGGVLVLTPDRDVASVVLSNEGVVSVDVRGARKVVIFGNKEGTAEVMLMDSAQRQIERHQVVVVADTSALESLIAESAPGTSISISRASGVAVLSGSSPNAAMSLLAMEIAAGGMPGVKIINRIQSSNSDQLAVSVRVMEVRRSKLQEVGLRWQAQNTFNEGTGSIGNLLASALGKAGSTALFGSAKFTVDRLAFDVFLNFLRNEGVATMLAEPTIVATSGQKAKMLAGGELPIPTPQTNGNSTSIGIEYKPYGITLEFTAIILDDNSVRLNLAPEVSQIDLANFVELNGAKVPGLITRKTETTVTLNFGESVVIAGLRSRETQKNKSGLPFGGDFLTASRAAREADTELVIIVTPLRLDEAPGHMPPASIDAILESLK